MIMTKQEFISASLPYKLKMKSPYGFRPNWKESTGIVRVVNLTVDLYADIENRTFTDDFIPIVRPLSNLTKEIVQADYNDGKPFVPIKIMLNEIIESWAEVGLNYPNDETGLYKDIVSNINYCEYWIIKLLLKWHFDLITEDCEKVYVTDEFNPYNMKTLKQWNKTGIELIAEERQRQIEVEGWTLKHDLRHKDNDLAVAASCYCLPPGQREFRVRDQWPFEYESWKPTPENRIRELQKAGALIAAEIDRIQNLWK